MPPLVRVEAGGEIVPGDPGYSGSRLHQYCLHLGFTLPQRVAGTHGRRRGGAMNREDAQKLLGGYATGNLTAEEQRLLFEAALDDQELFDALAEEQALKDVFDDPVSRERVRLAVAAAPRARGWWARPWIWS